MDKNSRIGIVLMGLSLFGFTFYQSRQFQKQAEVQYQLDSIARAEQLAQAAQDSIYALEHPVDSSAVVVAASAIYKDSLLELSHKAEAAVYTIQNEKIALSISTKGAQPVSAEVKGYRTYDDEELFLFKEGNSKYSVNVYTGEYISTSDFVFNLVEQNDSSSVMRLPFSGGG